MYDPIFSDFPKADPVERGCGEREPGGVYCESGLSSHGRPLEDFLIDPPLPIPDGLDLINKPQLWQRLSPYGEPMLDAQGQPVFDLLIWVGSEHYPYCPDFLEEVKRYGASRRLNPNLDLALLSAASRMILAHPKVINTAWQEQRPPQVCEKHILGHALADPDPDADPDTALDVEDIAWDEADEADARGKEAEDDPGASVRRLRQAVDEILAGASGQRPEQTAIAPSHRGPCLFKTWDLIPIDIAQTVIDVQGEGPLCLRAIGSTTYSFRPSGESAAGLVPGLFAALPITGFALITFDDGSVNEKAKQHILAGLEAHGDHAVPYYESER